MVSTIQPLHSYSRDTLERSNVNTVYHCTVDICLSKVLKWLSMWSTTSVLYASTKGHRAPNREYIPVHTRGSILTFRRKGRIPPKFTNQSPTTKLYRGINILMISAWSLKFLWYVVISNKMYWTSNVNPSWRVDIAATSIQILGIFVSVAMLQIMQRCSHFNPEILSSGFAEALVMAEEVLLLPLQWSLPHPQHIITPATQLFLIPVKYYVPYIYLLQLLALLVIPPCVPLPPPAQVLVLVPPPVPVPATSTKSTRSLRRRTPTSCMHVALAICTLRSVFCGTSLLQGDMLLLLMV